MLLKNAPILCGLLALVSLGMKFSGQVRGADRPNVIFILSDDQGWGDYSFMGHPSIQTPNLDQLARESLLFTRGYVPDSLCRPSLATILSGLYPHQHRIVGNDPPLPPSLSNLKSKPYSDPRYQKQREEYYQHIDRVATLPKILKPLGYTSFQAGKWWEGNFSRGGFDFGMTHGDMSRGARHGDEGLRVGREGLGAIDSFLRDNEDGSKPFFLWYAPMMPHTPHDPPERILAKYRDRTESLSMAKYWAMCEWFDETIGELRSLLKRHRQDSNTMILYVCDNGWINDPTESRYAPRSKRSPNEGGVRTPIMVHWPSSIQPFSDDLHLASSIDLVPTVLKALEIPIPASMQGIPLQDRKQVEARKSIFGEIFEHDIVDMENPEASLMYRWVIEDKWKLIVPNLERVPDGKLELYQVIEDPTEQTNLIEVHPEIVQRLKDSFPPWIP